MINKLLIDTLKPLNIPVSFLKYTGKETTYITFFNYITQGEQYGDDSELVTGNYIQVDVFSRSDYTNIVAQVKQLLKNVGFSRLTEVDLYENDTGYYHKGIRLFYSEEV